MTAKRNPEPPKRLPRTTVLGYSAGSLGTGIYSSVPSVLLLFYMTDTLAIPAGLAAVAIFLPKAWDVVTDPVMGYISDHTRSKWGRRRPYLLIGALLMSTTFIFLFNAPDYASTGSKFLYVLIVFTLSATAYTVFAVPYISMPAEMSRDHKERTTIMSYRMAFVMTGILIGSAVAPYLVAWFGGGRAGYGLMSLALGGVCALSMLVSFFGTKNVRFTERRSEQRGKFIDFIVIFLQTPAFSILVAVYLLQLTALGVFSAAVPYFVTYILDAPPEMIGAFFSIVLGAAILAMALWNRIAIAIGKRAAFSLSAALFGAGALSLFLTSDAAPISQICIQLAFVGAGLAGVQMLPFSMLTDVIRTDAMRSGEQREGAFTGLWTASEKLGLAIGPLIVGWVLSAAGFQESSAGVAVAQSPAAIAGIRTCVAALPGVAILCSAVFVFFYPVTEKDLERMEAAGADIPSR